MAEQSGQVSLCIGEGSLLLHNELIEGEGSEFFGHNPDRCGVNGK
jgi:hypothetical protein